MKNVLCRYVRKWGDLANPVTYIGIMLKAFGDSCSKLCWYNWQVSNLHTQIALYAHENFF